MRTTRVISIAVLLVVLPGCGNLGRDSGSQAQWKPTNPPAPGDFVLAGAIYQRLAERFTRTVLPFSEQGGNIAAPLTVGYSPIATVTPDGRGLIYSTWDYESGPPQANDPPAATGTRVAHPAIRLLDLVSGSDRLVADGAVGPVVSASGQVAYVRGTRPDYFANRPFDGTIEVIDLGSGEEPRRLVASSGAYRLVGWAGQYLLFYVQGEGETLDLHALGPNGQPRLLGGEIGVVAVRPDGREVLVTSLGAPPQRLTLLDVATGDAVAQIEDPRGPGGESAAMVMNGDWATDGRIVGAASTFAGLVYLRYDEDLTVESTTELGRDRFPWDLQTPRFSANGSPMP